MDNEQRECEVPSEIYDKDYYLRDNEGFSEFLGGLDKHIHPKFERVMAWAGVREGMRILDIGCGRGELLYYCATKGAHVLGVDYSQAAIELCRTTIQAIPPAYRNLARAECVDICRYDFHEEFDLVFIVEVIEHLTDKQVSDLIAKVHKILKKGGRVFISTPNFYYEKYLSPTKRFFDIPFKMIKEPLRVLRGKYRPKNLKDFLRRIFRIQVDRGAKGKQMHVNVMTPGKLRRALRDFARSSVRCEDHSFNPISLALKKWWGRDIIAIGIKSS
ncbi:MAG: class I SAM-dependent methyltransferase [Candidatus Omnitrophota bacterium]